MQYQSEIPVFLSAEKIKKQMQEWEVISKNQTVVDRISESFGEVVLPSASVASSEFQSSTVNKSFAAENLLRHYYHGHQTLGVGKVDAAVAKGSRALHVRSRHNAGPARRALALYGQYIEEQLQKNPRYLDFGLKTANLHDKVLPSKLLSYLKEDLLTRGEPLNLKGALAAVIYVIQAKCHINPINLETINDEIAFAKAEKGMSANNTVSFWRNPLSYFSGLSSKAVLSPSASDVQFDQECTSFEAEL